MPRTSKLLAAFLIFAALGCHKPKPGDPPHSKVGVAVAPPPGQTVNYDPSVVGLGAAIGTTVYDSQGVILWLKYGAPLTSWRAVPVSPLVTGDPSQSPGLKAPIGFTVTMNDGSASWVKQTSSDTGWVTNPVSGGGGIPDGGVAITTADGGGLAGNGKVASPLALSVPLNVVVTTPGVQPCMNIKSTDLSTGSPYIAFLSSTGTLLADIRVDRLGSINITPQSTGYGTLWTPGESQPRFQWHTEGISWFGGSLAAQQAVGADLTNGLTGGTAGTLTTFDGSSYATDASIIQGDLNQLSIKVKALEDALKAYSLLSH